MRVVTGGCELIGQAKGVLMAKHQIDATAAFAMLVRASQEMNIKVADVASRYINDSAQRADRPPPDTASMT
jgi:AmiR/NasT family two-component response regulator